MICCVEFGISCHELLCCNSCIILVGYEFEKGFEVEDFFYIEVVLRTDLDDRLDYCCCYNRWSKKDLWILMVVIQWQGDTVLDSDTRLRRGLRTICGVGWKEYGDFKWKLRFFC